MECKSVQNHKLATRLYITEPRFHLLNFIGWLLFALIWVVLYSPFGFEPSDYFKMMVSNCIIPLLVTNVLRWFIHGLDLNDRSFQTCVLFLSCAAFVAAIVWFVTDTFFTLLYYNYHYSILNEITVGSSTKRVVGIFILLLLWCALYFIIKLFYQWQNEKEIKERALSNALETRIEVLKNQINPHFLFNSLNTISAMIDESPAKAQLIIEELSSFLRYTLTCRQREFVGFGQEIAFVNNYVYIQSIRFEENLLFTKNIDPICIHFPVPPAILYPLVENAIKHGIESSPTPLRVRLEASLDKDFLLISVKNSGKWIPVESHCFKMGTGNGLKNVEQRLECEYAGKAQFEIIKGDDLTEVRMRIPNIERNIKHGAKLQFQGTDCG